MALVRSTTAPFDTPEWIDDWSLVKLRTIWDEENKLKDGSEIVVAEKGGRVVGFIMFKVESDYVYIDDVYVTKDAQRKGIGKSLVEYVEKVAVVSRCFCIRTDTTENTEGVPWKSYGFWLEWATKIRRAVADKMGL